MTNNEPNQQQYPQNYPPYEDEINLIDYLRVIWKWKLFIVLMVILCAGAAMGLTLVKYPAKQITQCVISLNFPGIEKHNNPDGSMFAKEQIITPAILTKASAFLEKENQITADIRAMIDVKPIIPPEILARIEDAEKKKETYNFFPNQFSLVLISQRKKIFFAAEKERILHEVICEYRKEFERKFTEEPLVTINISADFLAKYDYPEIVSIFQTKIHNFIKFLDAKIKKAGFFRSQKTGASFVDIRDDIELLQNIELANAESVVETLKLTKNREDLINKYKYRIKEIAIQEKKKEREAAIALKLLKETEHGDRYGYSGSGSNREKAGSTSLVLDSSFIENLVKNDYYTFLLKTALKADVEAKSLGVDKEFLEEKITALKDKEKEKEKEKEKVARLKQSLKSIRQKLISESDKANEINKEYLKKIVSGAVKVVSGPEISMIRAKSMKKIALLAVVVSFFFAIFFAFFIEYLKNASKASSANKRT